MTTPSIQTMVSARTAADRQREAFGTLASLRGLTAIVALTVLDNHASIRVMQRLGMTRSIEFDHPNYPTGHQLCRHVLYRLERD